MAEKTLLTMESVLPFGKYKGKTIDYITDNDPGYIVWMSENIDRYAFDGEILENAIDDMMERESTYESEWDATGAGDQ